MQDLCIMCKIMTKIKNIHFRFYALKLTPGSRPFQRPWALRLRRARQHHETIHDCRQPRSGGACCPSTGPAATPAHYLAPAGASPSCQAGSPRRPGLGRCWPAGWASLPVTGRQPETTLTWSWPSPTRTVHDAAQGLSTNAAAAGRGRSWLGQLKFISMSRFLFKNGYLGIFLCRSIAKGGGEGRGGGSARQRSCDGEIHGGLRPWWRRGHERRA